MSTIKVDTIATRTGSGNITASNTIAGTSATLSGTLAVTGNSTANSINLGGRTLGAGGTPLGVNFSSASTNGMQINDTNSGNLGGMLGFYSGSGTGTLRANIQNANNAGVHMCVGTGGSVTFGNTGYTAANALDDYEEGTFTPTFNQGFASPTYSIQVGRYTKIGQTVQFHLHIDINTVGSASSAQWKLGGLPFTSLNVANVWGGAFSVYTGGVHDHNFDNQVYWAIGPGQTTVIAYKASGGTYPGTSVSAPTGGFYIVGQYLTAS